MSNTLHTLTPAEGSVRANKRKGRGQGSGRGGTSTRGHKGQQSRSGYSRKRHHQGGQTPLQMQLPKRGFKNPNRLSYRSLSLKDLQYISEKHGLDTIDFEALRSVKMVKKTDKVKVLADGELNKALTITLHAFSEAAKKAIEEAGGTANVIA